VITEIVDDRLLAEFFRSDPFLHLYSLGDLDPFFRPHARWWGLRTTNASLSEVVLIYDSGSLPVLLAFTRDPEGMRLLLSGVRDRLPGRFYAHLSPETEGALADGFRLESHGRHLRMGLIDDAKTATESAGVTAASMAAGSAPRAADLAARTSPPTADLVVLSTRDLAEVLELFAASYPGNWFDPRMLETGQYVGARADGSLVAIAGVHVYSPEYRVAALGNITTRPAYRGKGFARLLTGALCRRLLDHVDWIGLNVHAGNAAAIACYRGLGFARLADYEEFMVERRA
jgi:RimJ/RimL family protein N-acetyltransferase